MTIEQALLTDDFQREDGCSPERRNLRIVLGTIGGYNPEQLYVV